jgi:hypothetical protein
MHTAMIAMPLTRYLMILLVALLSFTACTSGHVQEPWTGGRGELAKQKWESPPAPQRLNEMRTRLLTTQSDH